MKKNQNKSKKTSDSSVLLPGDEITEARMDEGLIAMAVGIRHGPNFSVEDQLGKIVDNILYSKETYFGPDVFTRCLHQPNGKILTDSTTDATGDTIEELENRLRINISDIILDISFGKRFKAEDFNSLVDNFNEQIVDGVMTEFQIRKIRRVGIVRKYHFNISELAKSFANRTIGGTLDGVNDIFLRFSKKMTVEKSFLEQKTNDYKNAIISILKPPDSDDISVLLDFQRYYDPSPSKASQIGFSKFVQDSANFTKNTFRIWLNKYLLEESRG